MENALYKYLFIIIIIKVVLSSFFDNLLMSRIMEAEWQ